MLGNNRTWAIGMKIDREIDDSVDFGSSGWKLIELETPRVTLSVLWCDGDVPLMFGIEGELDRPWTISFTESLKRIEPQEFIGKVCALPNQSPFECCGFIGGKDRRLLRGVEEDNAFIQAVPMYWCELPPDTMPPPFDTLRAWTNIFDMRRTPQPWFEYRMKGGKSGLNVANWRLERYSTFQGFIRILSAEDNSWLEIRNRHGIVLKLPDQEGWSDAERRVLSHLHSV